MSLVEFAKSELDRMPKDKDGMQESINKDIIDIVDRFSSQGHSGFSAGYALNVLERLLRFKPISRLEDIDEDWDACGTNTKYDEYQNKRCSSVFKKVFKDGTIKYFDMDKDIISDNGGITWFKSGMFSREVEFPYYPPTHPNKIYIKYLDDKESDFINISDFPKTIRELYEVKRKEFDSAWEKDKEEWLS